MVNFVFFYSFMLNLIVHTIRKFHNAKKQNQR
jgi:hypothetical protein